MNEAGSGCVFSKAWIRIQILYIRIQNSAKFGYKAIIIFNCFNSHIHRDPTGRPNQYVTAIQAVGEIIQVCNGEENFVVKVKFRSILMEIEKSYFSSRSYSQNSNILFLIKIIFFRITTRTISTPL